MRVLNSIITWMFKQRVGQFKDMVANPHQTQQRVFSKNIQFAAQTAYGKHYEFDSINSFSSFQNRLPIHTYESIFPYINRLMQGEQNVLWPTTIEWFAKSSGTTSGKSKFIPVSKETLEECHFTTGKDMMALYCENNPDTLLFSGKSLIMGGSHQINELNATSKYGDVSAVMMQNMPFWSQLIRTPELKIALLDEWEQKLELMAKQTMKQNVTNIAGVPTWTLVLLKHILELTSKRDISEIWPNLELYIHGGLNFTPYEKQFNQLISSPNMKYYQVYNASEGCFGMQMENNVDDMMLMLDYGIFYEFIPKAQMNDEHPKTLSLAEVQVGQQYALVISTNSGLWRYKVGDLIEFTSINPYKIKVAGRTKSFINAFGEEVIVENADKAIAMACKATNAVVNEYTAAPIYFSDTKDKGAHQWLVEFEKEPDDLEKFAKILDESLQSINSDYEAKRHKSIALEQLHLQSLPRHSFKKWLKSKGKLGGQNKVPRLKNDRSIIEEISSLL